MKLRLRAPAKVNLGLEIIGRRADGWHDIVSVVQAIDLCDLLEAEPARDVSLVAPAELGPIEENLVFRAALLLRQAAGISKGASLTLKKVIPHGVGLGGGSSDAAAALRVLRRLWAIPIEAGAMHELAAQLGSDVPFFLSQSAALIRGRGDLVDSLPPLRGMHFVLVVPIWRVAEKTRRVYAAVRPNEYSSGATAWPLAEALRAAAKVDHNLLANDLRPAAGRLFPDLVDLQDSLEALTGARFSLSGSGPTLFHLAASRPQAERCARLASALSAPVYVARPVVHHSYIRAIRF